MHQEKWFPTKPWLNASTLRVSYGKQGNVVSNVSPKALVSHVPSDPITDELPATGTTSQSRFEMGEDIILECRIDLSLFQNSMEVSFDYYKKETSDIVVEKEIPVKTGSAKCTSTAVPLIARDMNYRSSYRHSPRDWSWTVNFTAAYMKDILKGVTRMRP